MIKVIKKDYFTVKCKGCGCQLSFDSSDIKYFRYDGGFGSSEYKGIICPLCKRKIYEDRFKKIENEDEKN